MKAFKKVRILMAAALIMGAAMLGGCGGGAAGDGQASSGKVTASGSSALLPLLKPAQEEFHAQHKDVTVNIAGGGSFTGMNQVASGTVDIGNSDVELPAEYADKGLVDHKVVVMPFVFITNPDVTVTNLTKQQYVGILTGKITNWKQVGGQDAPITLIHRAKSSGSRATIARTVLNDAPFTDQAVIQDSNGAVRSAVASTPGAIGYVDAPYADDTVKVLAFDGTAYSPEAVTAGRYPVWTYGHMYTKGEPQGAVKAFLDYVMSDGFQNQYVEKTGLIPISKMK